jgi:hypothetical protein
VILGVVGHEAAKFTAETEAQARDAIVSAVLRHGATRIVSGHCHLGGVDIWAEEAAATLGLELTVYAPGMLRWGGPLGFRARNLRIARVSSLVLCVVVRELPQGYTGMRFAECYHCRNRNPAHVKSGGCWTAWQCAAREWAIL